MCGRPQTETKALAKRNGQLFRSHTRSRDVKTPQRPRMRLIGFETQTPLDEQSRDHTISALRACFRKCAAEPSARLAVEHLPRYVLHNHCMVKQFNEATI